MPVTGESDALVIGAGPTGCAAGITLARRGFRVTVVDRAVFPRDKTCGDAISNDGVEILRRLGVEPLLGEAPRATVARSAAGFPTAPASRASTSARASSCRATTWTTACAARCSRPAPGSCRGSK
jgi:2-polyprenyl-6-methoxyphenol hydroxylase-like FAD-dependent oxidoreductase